MPGLYFAFVHDVYAAIGGAGDCVGVYPDLELAMHEALGARGKFAGAKMVYICELTKLNRGDVRLDLTKTYQYTRCKWESVHVQTDARVSINPKYAPPPRQDPELWDPNDQVGLGNIEL